MQDFTEKYITGANVGIVFLMLWIFLAVIFFWWGTRLPSSGRQGDGLFGLAVMSVASTFPLSAVLMLLMVFLVIYSPLILAVAVIMLLIYWIKKLTGK